EVDADQHERHEQRRVPEDPFPGPVVAEPPFDRGGDVERQLKVHRIGRDTVHNQSRREGLYDEADGERDEGAGSKTAYHLERQDEAQVRREWQQRVRDREYETRDRQHSARAEDRPKPDRNRPNQHLTDCEGGRNPGTLVKASMNSTPNVSKAEGGNAAVQR